jgi:SOS-response transcriptional repressor LexA
MKVTEKEVYDEVRRFIDENGYSPSIRDLCRKFGVSTSTMHKRVDTMCFRRMLSRKRGLSRSLVPLPESEWKNDVGVLHTKQQDEQGRYASSSGRD